jgi:hypothetical protein
VIPHASIFQASMTAGSGGASPARVDEPGSGPSGEGAEGPGNMQTGMQAANVVPGATSSHWQPMYVPHVVHLCLY